MLDPEGWRDHMDEVREAARKLVAAGEAVFKQRGRVVDLDTVRGPIRIAAVNPYHDIDFRKHPELYRVGRGEQGVLSAEPYKSELLPLWRFRTKEVAETSSAAIWKAFAAYRRAGDFVGMDMARKYLQMGFTRARRYANEVSAAIFREVWQRAERDRTYRGARRAHVEAMAAKKKNSLVNNINRRKKAGKSRPKKRSTVSKESYDQMEKGWPKSKKKSAAKRKTATKKKKAASKRKTKKKA